MFEFFVKSFAIAFTGMVVAGILWGFGLVLERAIDIEFPEIEKIVECETPCD